MAGNCDKATAMRVLRRLRSGGHIAYFAGGCVRDMLLGRKCRDYDIATDATPRQVRRMFKRVLMIGAKFGVAIVITKDRRGKQRTVEVATFRDDMSYSDGRRPDAVRYVSPREDAERRDFTINGMFLDPVRNEVIDYVGGRADLSAGIIRTIGSPGKRFGEDYLRMLRAARFSCRLGFPIEPRTAAGIRRHAARIVSISGERIFDELTEIFASDNRTGALRQLEDLGLAGRILPEMYDSSRLWNSALRRLGLLRKKAGSDLAFGVFFSELSADEIRRIARRWGASNVWKKMLLALSQQRDGWKSATEIELCCFKRLMSGGQWDRLLELWRINEKLETGGRRQRLQIARRAGAIDPRKIAPDPFVGGDDLKAMGISEGRQLGVILRKLHDAQLNERIRTRKQAMEEARRLMKDLDQGS